jgi:hypothetical protein
MNFTGMIESLAVSPFAEEQVERVLQDDEFWFAERFKIFRRRLAEKRIICAEGWQCCNG